MSYNLPLHGDKGGSFFPQRRFGGGLWGAEELLKAQGRINENKYLRQACEVVCTGQMLYGIVSALTSAIFLFSFIRFSGVVISLLLIAVGLMGLVGSVRGNRLLLNGHIFTVLLAMMLTYDFSAQVTRDTQVDCGIAELFQRQQMTIKALESSQKQELVSQLFIRINEMEDLIKMNHESAVAAMTVREEQQGLKLNDERYIKAKTQMLRDHADKLIDDLMSNELVTNEWVESLSQEQTDILNKRLKAAEDVLDKISLIENQPDKEKLGYEEYVALLDTLTNAFQDPLHFEEHVGDHQQLLQAKQELPNMNAAIERQDNNKYHSLVLPSEAQEYMTNRQKALEERRHKWQRQFLEELQKHRNAHLENHDGLQDMPEHCLWEEGARNVIAYSGVVIIILQLVSASCVLTLLFALPKKEI